MQQFEFDVFLAHNSKDKPQVRAIAEQLTRYNLRPWFDEEQIFPGDNIQQVVSQGISQSKVGAFFISQNGLGTFQENLELGAIIQFFLRKHNQQGFRVIPILLGINDIPDSLFYLSQWAWIQFPSSNDEAALKRLIRGIRGRGAEVQAQPVIQIPDTPLIIEPKPPQSLSTEQQRRLQQKRDGLQQEWDLRSEKISRIRKALAIENSATVKFQLEQQLQDEVARLDDLNNEFNKMDALLSSQPGATQSKSSSPKVVETPISQPVEKPDFSPAPSPPGINLQTFRFETVTVDVRGNITNRRNCEAKYFVEDLGNGVTLEMVQIPGGKFLMGSPDGEEGRRDNEGPQHEVTVPSFFMGKYEVTQAQYQAIMGNNPSNFKGEKRPVEKVSWNDAVEFCKRLNEKTGRDYNLPSEAQWEYAARAGTTTPFYFGETITTDLANYNGDSTKDVGKFPPNSFGLYDMCGNVWEWCLNKYHNNYREAPKDGSAWLKGNEDYRLLRGGSWYDVAKDCRSASRVRGFPDNPSDIVGFRLVVLVA